MVRQKATGLALQQGARRLVDEPRVGMPEVVDQFRDFLVAAFRVPVYGLTQGAVHPLGNGRVSVAGRLIVQPARAPIVRHLAVGLGIRQELIGDHTQSE